MPRPRLPVHNPRSFKEQQRYDEFGTFVKKQRKELRLTQMQIARSVGVAQSQVYRWEQGVQLPRERTTMEKYANALALEGEALVLFYDLAGFKAGSDVEEVLKQKHLALFGNIIETEATWREQMIGFLEEARVAGHPELVLTQAEEMSTNILELVSQAPTLPLQRRLFRLLAKLRLVEAQAASLGSLPGEIWAREDTPFVRDMRWIAKECDDAQYFGQASYFMGDARYTARNYELAVPYLLEASNYVSTAEDKLMSQLGLIKAWAYLGDKEQSMRVVNATRGLIDSGQCTDIKVVCTSLEGIARAFGLFGDVDRALTILDEAKKVLAGVVKAEKAPSWQMQIMACELDIFRRWQPYDKDHIVRLATKGVTMAEVLRIPRQLHTFQTILNECGA